MSKKALLIMIGGRQVPNVLTALSLRPDIIVPIASHEAMEPGGDWEKVEPVLRKICPGGLKDPVEVNAYVAAESYMACLKSLMDHQDADWIVNVTCGSKIMGFGVYDAAMPMNLPMPVSIWYLDSTARQVVTLKGKPPEYDPFSLTVSEYFAAYGRRANGYSPSPEEIRLARLMADNAHYAKNVAKAVRNAEKVGDRIRLFLPSANLNSFLKMARSAGYIYSYEVGKSERRSGYGPSNVCEVQPSSDKSLRRFLTGDWLEIYAWWAASESGAFDDFQCEVKMIGKGVGNEVDLAATRFANILIAECKTEYTDFKQIKKKGYIEKLHSVADLIGGNFVQRLLIIAMPVPEHEDGLKSYETFRNQAAARQVVLVTGDKLKDLPEILRRESGAVGKPSFSTI